MSKLGFCMVSLMLLALASGNPSVAQQPPTSSMVRVVIGPPNDRQVADLLERPDLWHNTHSRVGAFVHADHSFTMISEPTLRHWFSAMRAQNLRLELEVGAIKEWSHEGEKTFEIERPIWERINRLGGDIMSVAMDEPLIATRHSLQQPDEYAEEQTARFIRKVRQIFPAVLVGDIEPYPAISAKDHVAWIERLSLRLRQMGVRGLDFYRIDPDWNAFPGQGDWEGVRAIFEASKSLHIPTSMIYWAARFGREKHRLPDLWTSEVLAEAGAFRAVGGKADQIVVESWIGLPEAALPDADPNTFSGSVEALTKLPRSAH